MFLFITWISKQTTVMENAIYKVKYNTEDWKCYLITEHLTALLACDSSAYALYVLKKIL